MPNLQNIPYLLYLDELTRLANELRQVYFSLFHDRISPTQADQAVTVIVHLHAQALADTLQLPLISDSPKFSLN